MLSFQPAKKESWTAEHNAAFAEAEISIRSFGLRFRSDCFSPHERVVAYFLYCALDSVHNGDAGLFEHSVFFCRSLCFRPRKEQREFATAIGAEIRKLEAYAGVNEKFEPKPMPLDRGSVHELVEAAVSAFTNPDEQEFHRSALYSLLKSVYAEMSPKKQVFLGKFHEYLLHCMDEGYDPYQFFQSPQRKIAEVILKFHTRVRLESRGKISPPLDEISGLSLPPPLPNELSA